MGGLVARYALADMTKKGQTTSTRLLITHDSPHEGANIPLGLQYLIEMAGAVQFFGYSLANVFPEYSEGINLLNQPATKELLLYSATGTNTFANNTFLSGAYRTMITFGSTGPQPTYQFIATSLGSQCGDALFSPYANLVNIKTNNFFFLLPIVSYKLLLNAQAYAMPSTGNTSTIASINFQSKFKLFGLITIAKQIYSNSAAAPGSQLPVDGAPGAVSNLLTTTNLPNLNPFIFPIPGILNIFGYVSGTATGRPATFSFVPVASALDASPFNTAVFSQPFIDGINPNYPSKANTFIAQEAIVNGAGTTSYNNVHITFTARNSQWLFDAMQGISNTLNCSSECSSGLIITGPAAFCSGSATYTLNVPATTPITWTASPTGIINLVPSGNTVSATKVSPNPVTIIASLNSCSAASLAISTLATSTVTAAMSGSCTNGVQDWLLTATPNMPGSNTNWQWTASPNSGITFSSPNSSSTTAYVTKGGGAQVTYKDQCGDISQTNGATIYSSCGHSFVVAPNPASSTLNVSLSPSLAASSSTTTISQINIYDNVAKPIKTKTFNQTKLATLDVSNLVTGIYVIEIIDESGNKERQALQIAK